MERQHKAQILRIGDEWAYMYIDSLMDSLLGFSVMAEISRMKKSRYKNNCQRFFEDMPEANNALFERLNGVKFI